MGVIRGPVAVVLTILLGGGMVVALSGGSSHVEHQNERWNSTLSPAVCSEPRFVRVMRVSTDSPRDVVAADLNRDGIPDLATVNTVTDTGPGTTVTVFLGMGDGSFGSPTAFDTVTQPGSIAVADFDRDDNLDLAVSSNSRSRISIHLGDGSGGMADGMTFPALAPSGFAAADLDQDGNPDLAVPNFFSSTVTIYRGNGDGSFDLLGVHSIGRQPSSVEIGDIDNDGVPDLAATNNYDATVSILLGHGDGTFAPQSLINVPGRNDLRSLVLSDLDQDGNLDMAVVNAFTPPLVAVFLGRGDGSFGPPDVYGLGQQPTRIGAVDFNGDQFIDLVVSNTDDGTISVLLGNGDGTIRQQSTIRVESGAFAIAIADLNCDASPDLAVGSAWEDSITILLNRCFSRPAAVTVCHCPPGTSERCRTLTLGADATAAHLDNHRSDYLGECLTSDEGRRIVRPCDPIRSLAR